MPNAFTALIAKKVSLGKVTAFALPIVGAIFAGGYQTYRAIHETKIKQLDEMKISEFQSVTGEMKKFQELLNDFTSNVASTGKIDDQKRFALSSSLVRLHGSLGVFATNLPVEREPVLRQLQASVNNVKKQVQSMEEKQDLRQLGEALVLMFRAVKEAQPVLDEAIGKPLPSRARPA